MPLDKEPVLRQDDDVHMRSSAGSSPAPLSAYSKLGLSRRSKKEKRVCGMKLCNLLLLLIGIQALVHLVRLIVLLADHFNEVKDFYDFSYRSEEHQAGLHRHHASTSGVHEADAVFEALAAAAVGALATSVAWHNQFDILLSMGVVSAVNLGLIIIHSLKVGRFDESSYDKKSMFDIKEPFKTRLIILIFAIFWDVVMYIVIMALSSAFYKSLTKSLNSSMYLV